MLIRSIFCYYLNLEKRVWTFNWRNLNSHHLKTLCDEFGRKLTIYYGKEDFEKLSMYVDYAVIISPWKRAWPFIWTNLNFLHPRMPCHKFSWYWPCDSGEEDKNVKSLRHRPQRRQQRSNFDQKSSLEQRTLWNSNINSPLIPWSVNP